MSELTSSANRPAAGTAVVTGASSGIGRVYAERLAERGHDLILVARRAERLQALTDDLRARCDAKVRTIVADLGDADELETVVQAIANDPSITMLVNNAGISTMGPLDGMAADVLLQTINVNVVALSRLTLAVLPGFKARDRGTIVNVGSVLGFQGMPMTAAYSGTKGYVLEFTWTLQREFADTSIVVQLVAPAGTVTEGWDSSTVDPSIVMSAEACVDVALRGLDRGETTTLPSVNDPELFARYETAAARLFEASQTGRTAERYALAASDH